MKNLYLLVGIPGSGKSTWVKQKHTSEVLISPDAFLQEKYNYEWTPKRASEAWAQAYHQFGRCLQQEHSIIWDATFVKVQDRSAPLNVAKAFGYRVVAVFFDTPLQVCLVRNRSRKRSPVPDETIKMMRRHLQCPTLKEGFDDVIQIEYSEV